MASKVNLAKEQYKNKKTSTASAFFPPVFDRRLCELLQVRNPRAICEIAFHSDPGGLLQGQHLAHQALNQTGEATR